ncbi:MAG TPA: aminomethyl-transferring glycine dehydrogenase subunit GcvPA [Clostridia bacterium]|jgi:glycine dehydrogenase subunit 1|nr:aminomethyl-transferring glycine dehydrogenase subunit GcvPA [Clostridia bacterium]
MSVYTPHTEREAEEMLKALGLSRLDELYSSIPREFLAREPEMEKGLSQMEVEKVIKHLAAKNKVYPVILRGAGAYSHYIPAAVRKLSERSEFLTAYTPYQAEISQGILQSIFEFQSMICAITGMEASNASHYDGASAAAEAALMCREKTRNKLIVSPFIKPDTLSVMRTYLTNMEIVVAAGTIDGKTDPDALKNIIDETTAAVYIEQPAYNGVIDDATAIGEIAHTAGAKFVMGCYPIALGLLRKPAECGADIAVGEGQPLGLNMAFGGPYLGFMATTKAMMRKLPGRIVGETVDKNGQRAYVLTLQAREQHIRREKASSNICTNQAHCALRAAMYLAAMGEKGLKDVATACTSNAHYLKDRLVSFGFKPKYSGEFFNEFVTVSETQSDVILDSLDKRGILGGLKLNDKEILWCATETVNKDDIDRAAGIIGEVVC